MFDFTNYIDLDAFCMIDYIIGEDNYRTREMRLGMRPNKMSKKGFAML